MTGEAQPQWEGPGVIGIALVCPDKPGEMCNPCCGVIRADDEPLIYPYEEGYGPSLDLGVDRSGQISTGGRHDVKVLCQVAKQALGVGVVFWPERTGRQVTE